MQSKAKTVEGYLAELPEERRAVLALLRGLFRKSAPTATEGMQYGMPCYSIGEPLCAVAAQKGHYSVYVADSKAVERFRSQLGKLSVGKGCIRFRKTEDVLPGRLEENPLRGRQSTDEWQDDAGL